MVYKMDNGNQQTQPSSGNNPANQQPITVQNQGNQSNISQPSNAPNTQKVPGAQKGNKGVFVKALAAIVVIAILAALVYLFIINKPLQSGNRVIALLSENKPIGIAAVANAMATTVNSMSKLNVSYTGMAKLSMVTPLTGNMSFSIPISFSYKKYYNISMLSMKMNIPIGGNTSSITIKNGSVLYTCTNSSMLGSLGGSAGYKCIKGTLSTESAPTTSFQNLETPNITNITKQFNITVQGTKELSYNNMPCYLMQGSGKIRSPSNLTNPTLIGVASANTNFTYNITSCVSIQYGVPLNFSATITSLNSEEPLNILFKLNAAYINNNTNSKIATLPGPIVPLANLSSGYPTGNLSSGYPTGAGINNTYYVNRTTDCGNFYVSDYNYSDTRYYTCTWSGGNITISLQGGDSGHIGVKITSLANGTVYYAKNSPVRCLTPMANIYLPAGEYQIYFNTGAGGGYCGPDILEMNAT